MKIFLSYTYADREYARNLATQLTADGFDIWTAEKEIDPGDNFALKIGKALEQSRAMIVLLSPDSVKSSWITSEIGLAIGSPNYEWRLIPVIVRPTEEIPWILKKMKPISVGKSPARAYRRIRDALRDAAQVVG